MRIDDIQTLFLHELADIYAAETLGAELLQKLADESSHQDVTAPLEYHAEETQQQIKKLDQIFKVLGTKPELTVSIVAEAIVAQHDRFIRDANPSETSLTMFNLGIVARMEHYEIASYQGLAQKAELLGEADCVHLLREVLEQEVQMAGAVEDLSDRLGRQLIEQVLA